MDNRFRHPRGALDPEEGAEAVDGPPRCPSSGGEQPSRGSVDALHIVGNRWAESGYVIEAGGDVGLPLLGLEAGCQPEATYECSALDFADGPFPRPALYLLPRAVVPVRAVMIEKTALASSRNPKVRADSNRGRAPEGREG